MLACDVAVAIVIVIVIVIGLEKGAAASQALVIHCRVHRNRRTRRVIVSSFIPGGSSQGDEIDRPRDFIPSRQWNRYETKQFDIDGHLAFKVDGDSHGIITREFAAHRPEAIAEGVEIDCVVCSGE